MVFNFKRFHLEAFFWIAAIGTLALTDPLKEGHASLCLIKNTGLGFCPGCGLGHSISWLFRGNIAASIQSHPLGIPAVIILLMRSYKLLKNDIYYTRQKSTNPPKNDGTNLQNDAGGRDGRSLLS